MEKILNAIPMPPGMQRLIEVSKILFHDMRRCDLFKHASAMAYVTLFSLIPSLAAVFGLISLFSPFLGENNEILNEAKTFILANLATGTGEQVIGQIDSFLVNLDMTKIGLSGFAGLLVSLILLLRQVEIALNRIWMVQKPRNIFTRFVHFWTFLTLAVLLVGLCIGILSGFDLGSFNPLDKSTIEQSKGMLKYFAPLIATLMFFLFLYKIVPNCFVSTKDALIGAVPATIMVSVAGVGYGWFAANFANYKAVYGALAAVPLFLMWLYILWIITLLGALLSWRSAQSFELSDDMDQTSELLTPEEKLRNHQLQASTPYLCLLAIYQRFATGDGKGLTGNELSLKLNIPAPWVIESLEALKELGYSILSQDNGEEDQSDALRSVYFPAIPAEKLSMAEVQSKFSQASIDWLDSWEYQWDTDFRPAIKKLWGDQPKTGSGDSMASIIAGLTINKAKTDS